MGWPYFQLGTQNYTTTAADSGFLEEGSIVRVSGEAEAFSLNYTLILDFFEHDIGYNIDLRCYVDAMNKYN